jgi:hypothetical protein
MPWLFLHFAESAPGNINHQMLPIFLRGSKLSVTPDAAQKDVWHSSSSSVLHCCHHRAHYQAQPDRAFGRLGGHMPIFFSCYGLNFVMNREVDFPARRDSRLFGDDSGTFLSQQDESMSTYCSA